MDFLQLKYFRDVAITENISQTAQKFLVPPSGISVYIKKLEAELQVPLFDRTANRIKLNNNGKIFLSAVNTAFTELDSAKNKLLSLPEIEGGEIRLLLGTNRKTITKFISKFKDDFPQVFFIIDHNNTSNHSGYDIIVSDQEVDPYYFNSKLLVKEEIKLAVNSDHILARTKNVDIGHLTNERFICMQKGSSLRECTDSLCKQHGFYPHIAIECDDPYYVREYVSMGMGIAFVPEYSWKDLFPENIVLITPNGPPVYRVTNVYTKKTAANFVQFFSDKLDISSL